MGLEGAPLSLPHVSFDVIQAEGHALVRAAPFGLLCHLQRGPQGGQGSQDTVGAAELTGSGEAP